MSLGIPAHPTPFNVAMGIIFIYQVTGPTTIASAGIPYFSLSLSLNVILTLMIVVRLTLHVGRSDCHRGNGKWWIVQGHRHHFRRVLSN